MAYKILIEGAPSKKHWLYSTYQNIHTRCSNKNVWQYAYYGGRGIKLRFTNFKTFYDYVSTLPRYQEVRESKLTIDRINNEGHYEVGNIKWSDKYEQSKNRRPNPLNKSGVTGVYFDSVYGLWRAQINRNGKRRFLKCSKDKQVCINARLKAEKEYA